MNNPNILWRSFRSLLFVLGAGFIIMLQTLPNNFDSSTFMLQHSLFAWCAAFLHRRPGSTHDLPLAFVALIYALYVEEGLALGAFALVAMVTLLRRIRDFTVDQPFVVEIIISTAVYILVIFVKNMILFVFLSPHYSISQLLTLSLSFLITYPVINFIIVFLVRSRKERSLAI